MEAVRAELERVLASRVFSGSERLSRFLRFVVEQSIGGEPDPPKEWLLGVRVFGRSESFDPRVDAIVRVEAGRLRLKLAQYYETEGHKDPVVIEVHKGSYAPVFQARTPLYYQAGQAAARGIEPDSLTSIVVLPFVNLSADRDDEYFSDGLTEDVIVGLTQIQGLRVVARSTAFRYKGQAQDIRRVSSELNVSAVLEGSVRRIGDRLRITAQLIDPRNCFHLWSRTFERQIKDIFAIQQEIAEAIGAVVRSQLPAAHPARETSDNSRLEAYDLNLRAMYFEGKRTVEGLSKGLEQLQLAADLDPQSAPIFARLANSHVLRAVYGLEPPAIAMKRAEDDAMRALEIDRTLAQAHAAKAFVKALSWDWSAADGMFRHALELNPGVPEIHHRYAVFCLSPLCKAEEALSHIKQAKRLEPMSLVLQATECAVLVWGGQYEAAMNKGKKIVELEPTYFLGHLYLSWAYVHQRMAAEAIETAREAVRLSAENPPALASLGISYALAGDMDKALELAERMQQRSCLPSYYISSVYASMGQIDEAFRWLARAESERSPALFSLRIGLWNERFRSDPRFDALVRTVGLSGDSDH